MSLSSSIYKLDKQTNRTQTIYLDRIQKQNKNEIETNRGQSFNLIQFAKLKLDFCFTIARLNVTQTFNFEFSFFVLF